MTPRPFTPRPYQQQAIEHIFANPRCALWAEMGLGKSSGTLAALDHFSLVEDVFPALVMAPLRVANSTWPDEVAKWSNFRHLRIVTITGDAPTRKNACEATAEIYTINYENIGWLIEHLDGEWPFRTIVADEATRLKGFRLRQGTKRAHALSQVAFKSKRFIELSGTPSPNGLKDLWGQLWFLDQGERLGRSYRAFEERWFAYRKIQDAVSGKVEIKPIIMPFAQEQIQGKLTDLCLSIKAKDHFDLREPIVNKIYVDLPSKARALYRDMEKQMYMELEGTGIEAFNAASRTVKCQQLANGAAYIDEEGNWKEVHDAKIQALESIIEEAAGMPVLVAYHFVSDLARLKRAFPQGRVLDAKPQTIKEWNAGKIPVMFAHPASAGHGLNLQDGGNILVYLSLDWNLENHMQILERIGPVRQMQAGHDRPVFVHMILARDTVDDEMILPRLESKRSVQEVLMESLKRRKGEVK